MEKLLMRSFTNDLPQYPPNIVEIPMLCPQLVALDVPFKVLHCPEKNIYICLHRFYLQFNTVPHLALIGFSVHFLSVAPHVIALLYITPKFPQVHLCNI